jgi:small conductance mechanosensitive channel
MPIDFSNAWNSGQKRIDSAILLLPNLLLSVIIFTVFLLVASAARSFVRRFSQHRQHHKNIGLLLGQLAHLSVVVRGFLIALSAVAASFRAGDSIKMLGLGSVAIGFAFQNVLQDFLAGILILLQEPFQIGDWIIITGFERRVEDIQTRATLITTAQWQRVVIHNAVLFTNLVVVGQPQPMESRPQPS